MRISRHCLDCGISFYDSSDYCYLCTIKGVSEDLLGQCHVNPETVKAKCVDDSDRLVRIMISRIEDLGRVRERLNSVLNDELLENLSKHNAYWHSEHDVDSDKLDDIRRKLSCLSDNLWDIWAILQNEHQEI